MAGLGVAGKTRTSTGNSMGRRVSTSRNTYMVASGQGPSKIPAKKSTGLAGLKGKATAQLKTAKR